MRSLRLVDLIFITIANILLLILLTLACLIVVIYLPINSNSSIQVNTTSTVNTNAQTASTTKITKTTSTTMEYPTTVQETTITTTTMTTTTTQAVYGDRCSSSNECKRFNSGTIRCLYGYCLSNGPSTRWQYDSTDEICKQNTGYNCALNNECLSNNCRFGLCT